MSENKFTVTFVAENANKRYDCENCDARDKDCMTMQLRCESEYQADGKNKIFKIKETK